MKKIILVCLLFFNYCSSPVQVNYFEFSLLEKIAQLSLIDPPPAVISFIPVYVIGNKDSVCESNFVKLKSVYKISYTNQYKKFENFLYDALNQKIKINTENPQAALYYFRSFLIESKISQLYAEKGVNGLVEKYCMNNKEPYTLNKDSLTLNEITSISYYFFLNQYIRADDDYEATISFIKLTSVINK